MMFIISIQQIGGISINGKDVYWFTEDKQNGQIKTIDTMLLGLQQSHALQQKFRSQEYQNYSINQASREIYYNGERLEFAFAQQLIQLKQQHNIQDVVVAVPCSFNNAQRQAVISSLKIAQINLLQLMNQPAALIQSQSNKYIKGGKKLLASVQYNQKEQLIQTCIAELNNNRLKVISVNNIKTNDFLQQNMFLKNQFKNYKNTIYQTICDEKQAQQISFTAGIKCVVVENNQSSYGALLQGELLYAQQQKAKREQQKKQQMDKSKINEEWIQKQKQYQEYQRQQQHQQEYQQEQPQQNYGIKIQDEVR